MNSQNPASTKESVALDQVPAKALEAEVKVFCAHHGLTPRESEIVALMVDGIVRIKDVADRLVLSPNTVNNHVNSIFMKTRTRSKSQLLAGLLSFVSEELQTARLLRHSPRVILLDGDEALTHALSEVFHARGFWVKTCKSQDHAMAVLTCFGPHFLVADLGTLNATGAEFIKSVQEKSPTQVLFTGAGAGVLNRWHAMGDGAIDVLSKPVDVVRLLRVLMSHYIESDLDRARYLGHQSDSFVGSKDVVVNSRNVGRGGVFLSADEIQSSFGRSVREGDLLGLKLHFDQMTHPIEAQGEVVWIRDGEEQGAPAGVGVRFTSLPRKHRETLYTFLHSKGTRCFIPSGVQN